MPSSLPLEDYRRQPLKVKFAAKLHDPWVSSRAGNLPEI